MFGSLRLRHVVAFSLLALLFADSAGAAPATPPRASIGPASDCPYRTVFVDPSNQTFSSVVPPEAENIRQAYLELAPTFLERRGFEMVPDRSEAWFILSTGVGTTYSGNPRVEVLFTPSVKLYHHIFIVMMNDDEIPFIGNMGTGSSREFWASWQMNDLASHVHDDVRTVVVMDSEKLQILCDASSKLVEEGWSEIEELRLQLVDEMTRIRRERKNATQRKRLQIEIEETADPPDSGTP